MKEQTLRIAIDLKDFDFLKQSAYSKDGFLNKDLRKEIWPLLLEFSETNSSRIAYLVHDWTRLLPHKDEEQIKLDVNRSFVYFPTPVSDIERKVLREHLEKILIRFFRIYPDLNYYQGLHDVASVFLLVLTNEDDAFHAFESFALQYLRDFMMPDMSSTVKTLQLIPELISKIDNELYKSWNLDEIAPFFALSPIITVFSHDLRNFDSLCLIFDQIISIGSATYIYYIYAALLLSKKDKISEKLILDDDGFSQVDQLHSALSKFLESVTYDDINLLLEKFDTIYQKYTPKKLVSRNKLNRYSSLKPQNAKLYYEQIIEFQIDEAKSKPKNNGQILKVTLTVGLVSILVHSILVRNSNLDFNGGHLYHNLVGIGATLNNWNDADLIGPVRNFWRGI